MGQWTDNQYQHRRSSDEHGDALRELIREAVRDAVRDALPGHECLADDELSAVRLLISRETQRAQFRKKIIDSSVAWAIPALLALLGLTLWTMLREYAIAHGVWKP